MQEHACELQAISERGDHIKINDRVRCCKDCNDAHQNTHLFVQICHIFRVLRAIRFDDVLRRRAGITMSRCIIESHGQHLDRVSSHT